MDDTTNQALENPRPHLETAPEKSTLGGLLGGKLMNHAADAVQGALNSQLRMVGSQLGRAGSALDSVIEKLVETSDNALVSYAGDLSELLHEGAQYLEEADLNKLLTDTKQFARQHTGLFVGGMLLLGFAAVRFSKSSASD
jgi:hypothetical protein